MSNEEKSQSESLKPLELVSEMDMGDFRRLMKERFAVLSDSTSGKGYLVRFTGQPYEVHSALTKSLTIPAHNRGTLVSPLCIGRVLEKFKISIKTFVDNQKTFKPLPKVIAMPKNPGKAS